MNANVDLIASGIKLLDKLNVKPGPKKDHSLLRNHEDLQETFAYYFNKGAGGERPFVVGRPFKELVSVAEELADTEVCLV